MKRFRYWLAIAAFSALAQQDSSNAQTIPNAGFEAWVAGNPTGWSTTNDPPTFLNVTQSTEVHSGSSAARGEVTQIAPGFGFPPALLTEPAFTMNSRPGALHGWYKASLATGDFFHVVVALMKADSGIGGGAFNTTTSTNAYQEFVVNIGYISGETPDSAIVSIQLSGTSGLATIGSYYIVDDLAWGAASAVGSSDNTSPDRFALEQNYPNPFNPSTTITYQLPAQGGVDGKAASSVRLVVYDMLGREVAVLVDAKQSPGTHEVKWNASGAASGVYLYRLSAYAEGSQTPSFVQTKLMTLIR